MSEDKDRMKCPHCHEPFAADVVAEVWKQSQVIWKIHPKPGEMFCASTVGGTLVDVEKMFAAIGKQMGVNTKCMVEKIVSGDDGSIAMHLLLVRVPKRLKLKEPEASAA